MKRIVLHVGPPKCASSTIQELRENEEAAAPFVFRMLGPKLLQKLTAGEAGALELFERNMLGGDLGDRVLILSHEVLFQAPDVLEGIARAAARFTDDLRVIGYSRPQSGFVRSAFCQWHFRSAERLKEAGGVLREAGFEPLVFSALERHVIAALLTGFHTARQQTGAHVLDWGAVYADLERRLDGTGARFSVGCVGHYPDGMSIIEDFMTRAGLSREDAPGDGTARANPQFDMALVEAVSAAILQGVPMPTPHSGNAFLSDLSNAAPRQPQRDEPFLKALMEAVDAAFWQGNQVFATRYGIDAAAFPNPRQITTDEAIARARDEQARRLADPRDLLERRQQVLARMAELSWARDVPSA